MKKKASKLRLLISISFLLFLFACTSGGGGGGGGDNAIHTTTDLNLYLYDDSQSLVDVSEGTESIETIQVATAGAYYISVKASSGASNYILSIGRTNQSIRYDRQGDFIPGDVIIAFKDNAPILDSEDTQSRRINVFGMTRKGGTPGRPQLFHFDSQETKRVMDAIGVRQPSHTLSGTIYATDNSIIDSDVNDPNAPYESNDTMNTAQILPNPVVLGGYTNTAFSGEPGRSYSSGDPEDYFRASLTQNQTIHLYIANHSSFSSDANSSQSPYSSGESSHALAQLKRDTLYVIQELNKREDILYAEPNYIRRACFTPDDQYYDLQWHYPLINLPQAWEITRGESGVIVAVIDTGILSQHPDIQGQLVNDGYDFISSISFSLDGNGIDDDPEDPGDELMGGSSFHGSHVSGTIAAATNNATGVAGVAGDVKIMPLRTLGKGGEGSSYDINQAILYAAGLPNDSGTTPTQKADIINMSLGGGGYSQTDQNTINDARSEGVIIIAAAGNESTSLESYPAAYDGVVSVSAVDRNKELTPYSNYGLTIDVAAPGGDTSQDADGDGYYDGVLSTSGDDMSGGSIDYMYTFLQGTSMACPHMAGVVALMKSVKQDLSPLDLDLILESGSITEDIGAPNKDPNYGNGLIDAYKAVSEAYEGTFPSILFVNPTSLNFGSSTENLTLLAEKAGDGILTVNSPTTDADWLTVSAEIVDPDGLGTYIATVDRTDLPDGPYYATIVFTSNKNQVNIRVTMYQGDILSIGDLGRHYVLLIDPYDYETVAQTAVSPIDGLYSYSFSSVPSGSYLILAGTDSDWDHWIGDAGEAFGAYISLDDPAVIDVTSDLTDLNFATSFSFNVPTDFSILNNPERVSINPNGFKRIQK